MLYKNLNNYLSNPNVIKELKHAYCPNFDTLNNIVKIYKKIEVVGVVTDICVLQTVIGLYTAKVNNCCNVEIVVDEQCCVSFNSEGHKFAINYIKNILGVEIT